MSATHLLLLLQPMIGLAALLVRLAARLPPPQAVPAQRAALLLCLAGAGIGASGLPLPEERPFTAPIRLQEPAGDGSRAVSIHLAGAAPLPAPALPSGPLSASALLLPGLVGAGWSLHRSRRLLRRSAPWRRFRAAELRVSADLTAPCSIRWGRPVVLIDPATAADPARLAVALRHELQHHRAGDTRMAWLLWALGLISPLAPLLRRPMIDAEELACDAALLRRGTPALSYARLLLDLGAPAPLPSLCASLHHPSLLSRRIRMLVHPPAPRPALRAALLALSLLTLPAAWAADGLVGRAGPALTDAARLQPAAARLSADFPEIHQPAVAAALSDLTSTPERRLWLRNSLDRARPLQGWIEAQLTAAGLPAALSAVPLVESGYRNLKGSDLSPSVPAHLRGAGYWMFIPSTARRYSLRVDEQGSAPADALIDERLDPEKETQAAIALLADGLLRYGTWPLALAAYNEGEKAVDAAIAAGAARAIDARAGFALHDAGLLRSYAAEVYAAALLMEDPALLP